MYTYTVPLSTPLLDHSDRENYLKLLREMKVGRVMLGTGPYFHDAENRARLMDSIKRNCEYFKANGFEVGAWLWTFLDPREDTEFTRILLPDGRKSKQSVCPSDPNFRKFAGDYIAEIAKCGVDLIMYDDDFRYGNLGDTVGCVCENHLAYMSEILGETVTLETLEGKLFNGGANKYRSAWIESKRHFFELFARDMRAALDKETPHVRLGICASYCSWNQDGITPYELTKILAGNTRPFFRMCSAPYWASRGSIAKHTMPDVIEFARLQLAFRGEEYKDTEVFSEGDTYPRPRWSCSSNYLESFDHAIRISGGSQGILKYSIDYISSSKYETGYNDRHIKNLPLCEKMDEMFADKECIGVRVFQYMKNYENTDVPEYIDKPNKLEHTDLPFASRMLSAANIPVAYGEGDTVGMVFGENAKYIPLEALKNGLILDARAAEILTARGVDVGLVKKGDRVKVALENFSVEDERIAIGGSFAYELTVNANAKIDSTFTVPSPHASTLGAPTLYTPFTEYESGSRTIIASYTYENANGEKFFVFAFDGGLMPEVLYRIYPRADQLKRIIPTLGKSYGFSICTSPFLYTIAKRDGNKTAVALWNFIADPVDEPFITLENGNAKIVSTIGCEAKLCNGVIKLSRLEPYGFAAVEYETN